jgi:selenocysteine-specific elongation factor
MRSIVVGTAGHIDHGKSALVRALTGTDPDRLKEEKARGITIDLGFANLEIDATNFAFVDVPGHERFVKNMLAGAGGIDLVMLVIAADESVMPQTREHFHICSVLKVAAGLIVLTKSDLVDRDMLELATLEARELAAGSFLEDAPVIAVSSKTGAGLDELRRSLVASASAVKGRDEDGPVRLPIDRVFSVKGFGTVVTGTLVSGKLTADEEVAVMPRDRRVKVRGLQVHGRSEPVAGAGRRVAINLGGIELTDLERGDVLCTPGAFEPTRRFDTVIDLLAGTRTLRHGARVRFHHGTSEILGRVALSSIKGSDAPPSEVSAGASAYARLRLEAPAVLTRGDRFILRAYSPPVTIGGGVVVDPQPPRGAIRTAAGRERLRRLDPARQDDDDVAMAFVEERAALGLPAAALMSRAGLMPSAAARAIERLLEAGRVRRAGLLLVAAAVIDDCSKRLMTALHAHHAAQPLSEGLPREEARDRIVGRAAPEVFDFVIEGLVTAGKLVARDRLALAGHRISLSPEEARAQEALERVYRDAGLAPPDLRIAAAGAGLDPAVADRMGRLLLRQKSLVKIEEMLFHADALASLRADVKALKSASANAAARVDVAAFKERYGISRKYAIPLLEYLDRERITRRVGDSRVVL